jgi:ubiquinone/menaquinone biosynthesis C-methylase UbiE
MTTQKQFIESRLPAQIRLYQMATGHYISRSLYVAAKLGIADLLKDGPRHYGDLAEVTETHAPSLNRVMRLLASVGVFEEKGNGNFALTTLGEALRTGVPGSARASVMLFSGVNIQDSWKELEYCVRTGEPAFRQRGFTDPFAELAQNPEEAANFDAAMADFTKMIAIAVAAAYDFSAFRAVVDVGGGNGALLLGILKVNPSLIGTVFDQPHVAERAKKQIDESGLADRCQFVGGDFFKAVPSGGDAYLIKHVIHDWDDARAIEILTSCRRVIATNGKLLIVEGIYPPRIDQSPESRRAAANDVSLLVISASGRQRSEVEFRSLYEAAGFRLTRIVPTMPRVSVIEGVPA